jgi:hypothetical protein
MKIGPSVVGCGCVATYVALVSCGESVTTPPPFQGTYATHADSARFMYVFDYNAGLIDVLTFPAGTFVRTVNDQGALCTDPTTGNLLVVGGGIDIYAAGGTNLLASLSIPADYAAYSCTVDARTGEIAAIGGNYVSNPQTGAVFVWSKKFEGPTTHADAQTQAVFDSGAYDRKGNLFVDGGSNGAVLNELPKGSDDWVEIATRNHDISANDRGTVQWDGTYITLEKPIANPAIYRLSISGSTARVESTVRLHGDRSTSRSSSVLTWSEGNAVVAPSHSATTIELWRYPQGGKPAGTLGSFEAALDVVIGRATSTR